MINWGDKETTLNSVDTTLGAPGVTGYGDRADEEGEQLALPGAERIGIIGGKGVGKSYLLSAMIYRTYSGVQGGVLSSYLRGVQLFKAYEWSDRAISLPLTAFVKGYMAWQRPRATTVEDRPWYHLRLSYRTGFLGTGRSVMDAQFGDGSGEAFEARPTSATRRTWGGYLDARVLVVCVPLWAAFPGAGLSRGDWQERTEFLEGFDQVVGNYLELRALSGSRQSVKVILVLTMADDRRSALTRLSEKWIRPYMESSHTYLRSLRSGSGIARYLANARRISAALHEEFGASRDPRVGSIPQTLGFGGRPWLIPTSAVCGDLLERIERDGPDRNREVLAAPVPVHVELPLFVAMCERTNALM
jgi:hypothetical protein